MFEINFDRDIVIFNYYSTKIFPNDCFLEISNELAHRNLFLFKCSGDGKIHFEFPMFENHSYNSICNRRGVRSLFKRKSNEKFIIFRTQDQNSKHRYIIGYYKIGKYYYQETKMFSNNGFVLGFESAETQLLKRMQIVFTDKSFGIGHNVSWNNSKINSKLNKFLDNIQSLEEDFSSSYQNETNYLISLFKNKIKMTEWKNYCKTCSFNGECYFYKYNKRYINKNPKSDMYELINYVYTSNIYSKNKLDEIPKKYVRCYL